MLSEVPEISYHLKRSCCLTYLRRYDHLFRLQEVDTSLLKEQRLAAAKELNSFLSTMLRADISRYTVIYLGYCLYISVPQAYILGAVI